MKRHTIGDAFEVWTASYEASGSVTDQVLKADPGAGKSLYVTDIAICAGTATAITLEEDGASDVLIYKLFAAGAGDNVSINLDTPVKLTENEALQVTTNGTGAILVGGYTARS